MRGSTRAALGGATAVLLLAEGALAYCRTTTCDPEDPAQLCVSDATGCVQEGLKLIWPERCVHFGTQKDGSPLRGITYEEANYVIQDAFRTWAYADCGGGAYPSLTVFDLGEPLGGIDCAEPEYNQNAPNANVWTFRDADWPYTGASSTLALTTITFEVPTGEILDADVELNTFSISISVGDRDIDNDLLSIATHEAGHFLGLSHSNQRNATMNANYSPGDIEFRTLADDDINGICEIYPPDRDVPTCEKSGPTPRHGFSRFCSSGLDPSTSGCACEVGPSPEPSTPTGAGAFTLVIAAAASTVRRRRAR